MDTVFRKLKNSEERDALEAEKTKVVSRLISQLKASDDSEIAIICSEQNMVAMKAWCAEVGLSVKCPTQDKTYAVVVLQ